MSHILVVDDDPFMRDALGFSLEMRGFEISLAAGVDEALRMLVDSADKSFDAVISDTQMPEKDGLVLLAELKRVESRFRGLPFILLSGDMTPELREKAIQGGAREALSKTERRLSGLLGELLNLND